MDISKSFTTGVPIKTSSVDIDIMVIYARKDPLEMELPRIFTAVLSVSVVTKLSTCEVLEGWQSLVYCAVLLRQ